MTFFAPEIIKRGPTKGGRGIQIGFNSVRRWGRRTFPFSDDVSFA